MATTKEEIARNIAAQISLKNMTQSGIAKESFIPLTTLHRKLHGSGDFTIPEVVAIAGALGVRFADLLPAELTQAMAA